MCFPKTEGSLSRTFNYTRRNYYRTCKTYHNQKLSNADKTKRFVAFCNYYRRFIKFFLEITRALNNLLKKNITFIWNEEYENNFILLNLNSFHYQFYSSQIKKKTLILTADALHFALGAVLSQGEIGFDLPISYAN